MKGGRTLTLHAQRVTIFRPPYSVDSGLLTDDTPYKSVLGILIGWSCAQWDHSHVS